MEEEASAILLCSVVVPVYNGETMIERCLDALANQTMPADRYEVIIVDDGSTDATASTVQSWMSGHPERPVRLLRQTNAGQAAARNRGAEAARAPLLLFTDADCAPLPHWISALVSTFADPEVVGAKGCYLTDQPGLVPRFVQTEYEDRYDRMRHSAQIDFIDTYSAAYRRLVFCKNGGFDTIFTTAGAATHPACEDQELSFRLAQKGYRLVFVPQAQVNHIHATGLWEYCRRKYYIGFWKALLTRWHPERMVQDSHTPQVLKVQMLLWAFLVGLLPIGLVSLFWPALSWTWWLGGLLVVVFLLTTWPFLAKLARCSWLLVLVGPPMLAARALALGIGYLTGAVHFAGTLPGARQPVIPGWKRLVKRLMDVVGALVGLAVSAPLLLIAAIAIKLDSPGPVFFSQTRIGENGRPFRMIKLRSIKVATDTHLRERVALNTLKEPVYKLPDDPRLTRVGRVLRRTGLDELPQFLNVLRGEMSLVGPRPEEAQTVELYNDHQRRRLAVKPGMTGPMQVNGRSDLPLGERLQLELDYIKGYSLGRDVEILVHTLPAIWHGKGAH